MNNSVKQVDTILNQTKDTSAEHSTVSFLYESVSKLFWHKADEGRQPGQIVIRQGCDTLDENIDVDPDHPAAA